jgi:hypothetical protein
MGLEGMNLDGSKSRFSTPRSSVLGLQDEEEEGGERVDRIVGKGKGIDGDVKIVGMDIEVGEGPGRDGENMGLGKMDVDS